MIAGIVAFTRKDSLYQARRLPNANVFWCVRNAHAPFKLWKTRYSSREHVPYAPARRYHLGNSRNIRASADRPLSHLSGVILVCSRVRRIVKQVISLLITVSAGCEKWQDLAII